MSRSASSQDHDRADRPLRPKHRAPGPAPVVMVPVKRIGRHTKRLYCERCGQKRRACRCPA